MSEDILEEGALLGHIQNLKYQEYNLQDPKNFSQFQDDQYMCKRIDLATQAEVLASQDWIERLAPSSLLNLLRIPHFGWSPELNIVVNVLLSCVHDRYLWLDHKMDLNVDVIHQIIVLSKVGEDPISHFLGKNLDRKLATKLIKDIQFI